MRNLDAVLFDVDFTLCRPGPELSAERYARIAARHGITLDTSRYDDAREAAQLNLKRHPELLHDETIWHRFTEEIFVGMGGLTRSPRSARRRSRRGGSQRRTSSSLRTCSPCSRSYALRA